MVPLKEEAKSVAKFVGEAEAYWEIVDWTGPLAHLMRTSAECFVNIPIFGNESTPEIKLRFYLKPYYRYKEPELVYCEKEDSFRNVNAYPTCYCNTCFDILQRMYDMPYEFPVDTRTRSSGYSLMVDVLSGPDNIALVVYVDKLNGMDLFGSKYNTVKVNSESGYQNLPVVDKLWRMARWMEGQNGEMEEWEYMSPDDVKDARFELKITAYKIQAEGSAETTPKFSRTDNANPISGTNLGKFSIKTDEQEGSNSHSDNDSFQDSFGVLERKIQNDSDDLKKFQTDLNFLMKKFKQII